MMQLALSLGTAEAGTGRLCLLDEGHRVVRCDTRERWVRCDGRFPHWVDDYCTEAERYTVIVYSTDAREATAPVGAVDWQFLADEGPGP